MAKRADAINNAGTAAAKGANRQAAGKPMNLKAVAGVMAIVLSALGLTAYLSYFFMSPAATLALQRSQFANQLSAMQSNSQKLAPYYITMAQNYHMPTNESWSAQVMDRDTANGPIIGQFTVSWHGQTKSLSIQNGTVNAGISPTYAVTVTHSAFMSFSQAVIARNTAAAFVYYSVYYFSGKLTYAKIR